MAVRKIQLFQSIQGYHRTMGIVQLQPNQHWLTFNWRNLIFLISFVQLTATTIAFSVFHAKTTIEFGTCYYAYMTEIGTIFYFFIQMRQINRFAELIEHFQEFIEKRVYARTMYDKLNEKIEMACHFIHIALVWVSTSGVVVPPLIVTILNYIVYGLEDESYYLAFPVMVPFNWRTPPGYLVAFLGETLSSACTIYTTTPIICFIVAACCLLAAFVEDIASEFTHFNANELADTNQTDVKKHFCKIIGMYTDVKELVIEYCIIYEYITTAFFIWSLLTICSSLLMIQTILTGVSDHSAHPLDVISAFVEMFWSFAMTFFFCEFGELVTNQFHQFDEELCQCDWYVFSMEMKQLYLTFMQITQQPELICGFGNIVCTRDVFKKTTNSGFSYFMMLRQMNDT